MGESVGPAVVVFGDGDKARLKAHLKQLHPTAAAAVLSVHSIKVGAPRYELHCRASQINLVESLVPMLNVHSRAVVWEYKKGSAEGPVGLARKADGGLNNAASKAGMCNYYVK